MVDKQDTDAKVIKLGNYLLKGTSLFIKEKDEEKYLANGIKVKNVLRQMEDGKIEVELEFFSYDQWETDRIPRGKLVKSELSNLLNKGMDVAGHKADHVFRFLDYHEKTVKPTYQHRGLGWMKWNGDLAFRLQQAIKKDHRFSSYNGYFLIEPKGTLECWKQIVCEEVIGHPQLEAALSASFASPIVSLLSIMKVDEIDSLLLNIVGNSTTGKTTLATVVASPFGSPSISHNGLIQSFNGTANALQAIISGNFGVPIVFDETSMNTMGKEALTSFIYKLAQNKDKTRLSKEAELRETQNWCTVMFFTGERSMLADAKNNVGLRVRMFEFESIQWTKDGGHAERIKEGLMNNYGHAGQVYIETLLQNDPMSIVEKWREMKEYILHKMPESNYKDRISNKFATILTGAHYANESLQLNLSVEQVANFLVAQEESSMDERELANKFYHDLKDKIIMYRKNFKINKTKTEKNQEIWGALELKDGKTYCYILELKYKDFVRELGFSDSKLLLEELRKKNYLKHEPNKLKTRKAVYLKEEMDKKQKAVGNNEYKPKGDYTVCVVYEGNILEGYFETDEDIRERLNSFNPNPKRQSRTVSVDELIDGEN